MIQFEQWEGFEGRIWKEEVNVRDFIQKNYTAWACSTCSPLVFSASAGWSIASCCC